MSRRGITTKVKLLIEKILSKSETKPKKIYNQLKRKRYFTKVDRMPSLLQIQYFIKYKRKQMGDNENIQELKNYIHKLIYEEGISDD